MQYSKLFSALIVGVLAGIQSCNAQSYRLSVETTETLTTVFTGVSWVNSADGGAYIGNVKLQQVAEPLIVVYNAPDGQMNFLTYHAERYQQWYIMKDQVQPVGLTMWQSIPAGATTTGFTICDGYLRYQKEDHWAVCPSTTYTSSYKIFYIGGGNPLPPDCIAVKLRAQEYGFCDLNYM